MRCYRSVNRPCSGERTPLLSRGGVTATSRKCCAATLIGAGGVVWSKNFLTTPPRLRGLRLLRDFFDRASTPPRLRRGVCTPEHGLMRQACYYSARTQNPHG